MGSSWDAQIPALTGAGYRVVAYDRRGFGRSDKPWRGYDYDSLTEDLESVLTELDLSDVTLVGFSMGGGEVANTSAPTGRRACTAWCSPPPSRPYMLQTDDNPEGPLPKAQAATMTKDLLADREAFFDQFTTDFFSAAGELKVTEAKRQEAIEMCLQSDQKAAVKCMASFGTEDFREDLPHVTVPTLVIHGDSDATVPFEGSGARTHAAISHSELVVLPGAPHGCKVSHPEAFNAALLDFLAR